MITHEDMRYVRIVSSSAIIETYTPIVPYTSRSKLVTVWAGSSGLVSYMIIALQCEISCTTGRAYDRLTDHNDIVRRPYAHLVHAPFVMV